MSQQSTETKDQKLSPATVKRISEIAAAAAVEAYKEAAEKDAEVRRDKRFNNTKLLLRKYRDLMAYTGNAVYEANQLMDDDLEIVLGAFGATAAEVRKVQSIRKNVAHTQSIMSHVKTMLDGYARTCIGTNKPEVQRKWRVIHSLYIADEAMTSTDIAAQEKIAISTVYSIVDSACEELSTLFFGLDLSTL